MYIFQVLCHKPRQLGADTRLLGGDGEYREQTQRHTRRYRVDVDPERYPRQDHQQYAGYVDLDEVVLKETIQFEMRFDTAESSCKTCSVVLIPVVSPRTRTASLVAACSRNEVSFCYDRSITIGYCTCGIADVTRFRADTSEIEFWQLHVWCVLHWHVFVPL